MVDILDYNVMQYPTPFVTVPFDSLIPSFCSTFVMFFCLLCSQYIIISQHRQSLASWLRQHPGSSHDMPKEHAYIIMHFQNHYINYIQLIIQVYTYIGYRNVYVAL